MRYITSTLAATTLVLLSSAAFAEQPTGTDAGLGTPSPTNGTTLSTPSSDTGLSGATSGDVSTDTTGDVSTDTTGNVGDTTTNTDSTDSSTITPCDPVTNPGCDKPQMPSSQLDGSTSTTTLPTSTGTSSTTPINSGM